MNGQFMVLSAAALMTLTSQQDVKMSRLLGIVFGLVTSAAGPALAQAPTQPESPASQITLLSVTRGDGKAGEAARGTISYDIQGTLGSIGNGRNAGLPEMTFTGQVRLDRLKTPALCSSRNVMVLNGFERYWTYSDDQITVRWGDYSDHLGVAVSNKGAVSMTLAWADSTITVGTEPPAVLLGGAGIVECETGSVIIPAGTTYIDSVLRQQGAGSQFHSHVPCKPGQPFKVALTLREGDAPAVSGYTFSFVCGAVRR